MTLCSFTVFRIARIRGPGPSAGAADELKQAYLLNPYDINGMKQAIVDAMQAQPRDLTRRMRAMRKTVKEHDVVGWAESFMGRLAEVRK